MNRDDGQGSGRLILASASPRRKRLLKELGYSFDVVVPDVKEVHYLNDLNGSVTENALLKCEWCLERHPDATILAADTGIDFKGHTIMKPRSQDEAAAFLRRFSGNTHTVMTGIGLAVPDREVRLHVESSRVTFRELTEETIRAYIEQVNPIDRAGAYDIDECGEMIVASHEGSFTNIVGLPCEVVAEWLWSHSKAAFGRNQGRDTTLVSALCEQDDPDGAKHDLDVEHPALVPEVEYVQDAHVMEVQVAASRYLPQAG